MRNHFLRAATPKGNPIEFVGAVSASGELYSSSALSVSTDDLVVIYTSGKNGDFGSATIGGTASLALIQASLTAGGDGGNDNLYDLRVYGATSGGTITLTGNDQDVMGAAIAFSGGDNLNFDQSTTSLSLSGIGSDDALLYVESHQATSVYPTLPSGFTNTGGDELWLVGKGGNAVNWSSRSGYLENPPASVSHTVSTQEAAHRAAILLQIYRA